MAEFKKILKRIKRSLKPFYFPFATKLFLVWLLAMFIGFLLSKYLYHVSFDYIITKLYDWDGGWYLRIIRHGYPSLKGHPSKFGNKALAFFPGYPILISAIAWIIHVPLEVAGILISWVAFFVTLHLSYYLLTNTWHKQKPFSRYAITLLALNPFSFWFGMLYTEALYIMLVTIIFICLGKKKYVWAAIAAGLASSVKDLGVFLGLVIVLDYIFSEKKSIVKSTWANFNKRNSGLHVVFKNSYRQRFSIC
jgi:Gpi18-like mannosyltransferase